MDKYTYRILNYWNDQDDLYVDYIVKNTEAFETAHACALYNTDDIDDYMGRSNINEDLIKLIKESNRNEFDLPKTSELSDITYDIYKELCDTDNNMIWIDDLDSFMAYNITTENFELLKNDIEKYNLNDYFEITDKSITVYGGLQCCFNDDVIEKKRSDELER